MEIKKTPKADLENKKSLFLMVGLVIALGITGIALSMSSKPVADEYKPPKKETTEVEQIDNSRQDMQEQQPEVEKAKVQVITDVLNIVSNDQKIDTNVAFIEDPDDFGDFEIVIEEKEEVIEEEEIFVNAEEMPTFQGGDLSKFRNWVQSNVRYPQIALENGIQGNVVIKFVVEKDGKLSNIQVLQSPDKTLSDAAVAVLQRSPKWKPGKQRNKPVRVTYTLPVSFKIQQ
ncbi:MAG: energy transducer TonB [Alistipes sp.]|nr:energy transducer TonB [Alistipes sp.]